MRNTCPNCGFKDGIYWRPRHFDTNIEICKLEDLQLMNANLADKIDELYDKLRSKALVMEGIYVYRMTKSGMVWRLEKKLWEDFGHKFSTPSDGAGSPKSARFKKAISKR